MKFTIVINAGGQSSRMGTDKALLEIGGKTLIEHIVAQTADLGGDQIIIANTPERYAFLGLPTFSDILPDKGALGGLYTSIHSATQAHALVLACDMPFVNRPLLQHILSLAPEFDAVVPRLSPLSQRERGDRGVRENSPPEAEPFRAVYSKACLEPIRRALGAGKMRVMSFFSEIRICWIEEDEIRQFDPELLTFMNCNTPEEFEELKTRWTQMNTDRTDSTDKDA